VKLSLHTTVDVLLTRKKGCCLGNQSIRSALTSCSRIRRMGRPRSYGTRKGAPVSGTAGVLSQRENAMSEATTAAVNAAGEGEQKLILASRVEDMPVFNTDGDRIGHIDDLSINRREGKIVWAIMSFGGFLGIGKRFHPLPWSVLDYDPEQGGYVMPLDKAALEGAPHYDAEELRDLGGARYADATAMLGSY
jgi:hypothetical protein